MKHVYICFYLSLIVSQTLISIRTEHQDFMTIDVGYLCHLLTCDLAEIWIHTGTYIKMKGEASPRQIGELENLFELNRDEDGIEQMREDVEAYEDAVRQQATLAEQARLKEQAAKEQESKAKSIKMKQGQPKDNLKSRN